MTVVAMTVLPLLSYKYFAFIMYYAFLLTYDRVGFYSAVTSGVVDNN